jgi:hypothetical protein
MENSDQKMSLLGGIKRYGGFVIAAMSGRLVLPIEIEERDVHIVLGSWFLMRTAYRTLILCL